tara:strand:+ start:376 stop:2091 length:1716 start_codon:yes stop_codon:yes gene_type:complete
MTPRIGWNLEPVRNENKSRPTQKRLYFILPDVQTMSDRIVRQATKESISVRQHQEDCAEAIKHTHGLLLRHGLGTGKTYTSIYMFETLNSQSGELKGKLKAQVIVPAKLQSNFANEVKNAGVRYDRYTISSYEKFLKDVSKIDNKKEYFKNTVLIVDEGHLIRNSATEKASVLEDVSAVCYKVIVLTGTPLVNYPNDISVLMKMVNPKSDLPMSWSSFKKRFVDTEYSFAPAFSFPFYKKVKSYKLKNLNQLYGSMRNHISCVYADVENFPRSYFTSKKVEMSEQQYTVYRAMEKENLDSRSREILYNGEDVSTNSQLNTFLNKTRSISNTLDGLSTVEQALSPKFAAVLNHLEKENRWPVVIYSFFLKSGVLAMKTLLDYGPYRTAIITGNTSMEEVAAAVNAYNDKKLDVLLLSGAAGFGLDLKRTAQIHILEPSWNKAKIDQVIGRGIRFKSHADLPPNMRFVNVYHWLSVIPRGVFNVFFNPRPSADEHLYELSMKKNALIEVFDEAMCQASIENNFLKSERSVEPTPISVNVRRRGRRGSSIRRRRTSLTPTKRRKRRSSRGSRSR